MQGGVKAVSQSISTRVNRSISQPSTLALPPGLPNHPPPAHADLRPLAALPHPRPSAFAIPHLCAPPRPLPPAWRPSRPPPSPPAPVLAGLVASPHHHAPGGREVDGALSRPSPKRNGAPNTCPDYCAFPGCSLSVREGSVRVVTPWNTRPPHHLRRVVLQP